LKNNENSCGVVPSYVLSWTPKHSNVSKKLLRKHENEQASSFKRALDDTLVGSASGKVMDWATGRITREQDALMKAANKSSKKLERMKKELAVPKKIEDKEPTVSIGKVDFNTDDFFI